MVALESVGDKLALESFGRGVSSNDALCSYLPSCERIDQMPSSLGVD